MCHDASHDAAVNFSVDFSLHPHQPTTHGGTHIIAQSELRERSICFNQNSAAMLDQSVINVGQPIAQTCSIFSAEDRIKDQQAFNVLRLGQGLDSRHREEYGPIIDDLTAEIRQLRAELKFHQAQGPRSLQDKQHFEISISNLPKHGRAQLDATLGLFANSLDNPSATRPRKSRPRVNQLSCFSPESGSPLYKHAIRPLDSAYASMSVDGGSGVTSCDRVPSTEGPEFATQKVEKYLDSIPADPCQMQGVIVDEKRNDWEGDFVSKSLVNIKQETRRHCCVNESRTLAKETTKASLQSLGSSNRFHYSPLFVHPDSPHESCALFDTLTLFGSDDGSLAETGYTHSKKRRRDGITIYYRNAPFCIDLSGDSGESLLAQDPARNMRNATTTFAQLPCRQPDTYYSTPEPNSQLGPVLLQLSQVIMKVDEKDPPGFLDEYGEAGDADFQFPWSEEQPQYTALQPLEPCGLGNVLPDDHFIVNVTTSRTKKDACWVHSKTEHGNNSKATDATVLPAFRPLYQRPRSSFPGAVKISYEDMCIKHLIPALLPLPIIFCPPANTLDASDSHSDSWEQEDASLPSLRSGDGFTD
ncbi:hypothetical protein PWT90_08473 [Aphanocladium album]|nr:hypothetical protein PWT90_08473 [Aphanocladium album]